MHAYSEISIGGVLDVKKSILNLSSQHVIKVFRKFITKVKLVTNTWNPNRLNFIE